MTKARDLYAKISTELDRATRERDDLRARLDAALADSVQRMEELSGLARILLPRAGEVLEGRFDHYVVEARAAAKNLEAAATSLREAQALEKTLHQEYVFANHDYGESAENRRRAMIGSEEYRDAANGLYLADTKLKGNELLLRSAEQKLARLTELARQNPVHGLLMSGEEDAAAGHFILSLVNAAGNRIRSTEWYRRADADRRAAKETIVARQEIKTAAEKELGRHRGVVDRKKAELEETMRPEYAELVLKKDAAETARRSRENAEKQMYIAEGRCRAVDEMTAPQTKAALAELVALLSRTTTSDSQDKADIDAIRATPSGADIITRASGISAELAKGRLSTIDIRERLEAAQGAVDELDKVRRKMKRSGMSSSSRKVDDVESFMASGGTGGFDLTTLVVLAAVSDSVSDASPSSSSDWSSSSSSSFD